MNVLVVVDMQNDFIDGSLGTPEARKIVPAVAKKIEEFDGAVIYTRDTHTEDYLSTQEGKHLPVEHCIYGKHGHEINSVIQEAFNKHGAISFNKKTFGSENLVSYLKTSKSLGTMDIDSIEIIGLCTDICVVSNALMLKAAFPEIPIYVDAGCCAGVTPETHKAALTTMRMCQIEIRGDID